MICFSALQRAENSSIHRIVELDTRVAAFQCSSASRKFLNQARVAEKDSRLRMFQCSSASRKFLNETLRAAHASARSLVSVLFSEPKIPQLKWETAPGAALKGFSALQRAENSSIKLPDPDVMPVMSVSVLFSEPKIPQSNAASSTITSTSVSVLFSEPKIPQSAHTRRMRMSQQRVSVLFSEPKIPQSVVSLAHKFPSVSFSALQRAENSSIGASTTATGLPTRVSVLFSEPKIPQSINVPFATRTPACFSALQRAENSSMRRLNVDGDVQKVFQCSSASRKFLNLPSAEDVLQKSLEVSVLFSEPKIPQSSHTRCSATREQVSVLFSEPKIPQSPR